MGKSKDLATGETRFVNTAGDTMTGNLAINNASGSQVTLHRSDTTIANDDLVGQIIMSGDDADSNSSGTRGYIRGRSQGTGGGLKMEFGTAGGGVAIGDPRMTINADGIVTMPSNPWFDVRGSGNSWTSASAGDNILNIFSTSLYQNTGGGFNSSNSTYTAPVAGRYCFLLNSYTKGGSTGAAGSYIYPRLFKNGSSIHPRSNILHYNPNQNYDLGVENTILVDLAANDTIQAGFNSNNTSNQYYPALYQLQMFFVG